MDAERPVICVPTLSMGTRITRNSKYEIRNPKQIQKECYGRRASRDMRSHAEHGNQDQLEVRNPKS